MNYVERALAFDCCGERLVGVVSEPASAGKLGVVVIVGGPQYRVGSHRQFVLFARRLAAEGLAVLRFDYRGMGDATGPIRQFEDTSEDIAAAIEALQASCPTVETIVLWGLCDAASGALLYWEKSVDARVGGIVLLNPWVRSDATIAKTYLKHYYGKRLFEKEFWAKLVRGEVNLKGALNSVVGNLKTANANTAATKASKSARFQDLMAAGMNSFAGPVLILLSEHDLTAKEFLEFAESNSSWAGLLARANIERNNIPHADHTFSTAGSREDAENRTVDWLRRMFPSELQ
jgi:exosortase A-associated hydrolase 1